MKLLRRKKDSVEAKLRLRTNDTRSPTVFSYYARGSSTNSQNTGRQTSDDKAVSYRHVLHIPSYIALSVLLVAILYALWLQPAPKVIIETQAGTVYRPTKDYVAGIANIWNRSLLNQTKLTIHTADLKRQILTQYGELADVNIELPLVGRRSTVILKPETPALRFVGRNGEFFVAASGKTMAKASDVTQNQLQNIPTVHDETSLSAEVGKSVLPETEVRYIQNLSAQLTAEAIPAESLTLPSAAAHEVDMKITGQSYYVKFSTLYEARQAVGAYQAVKAKLDSEHVAPKEYVDVRLEEKVFYK